MSIFIMFARVVEAFVSHPTLANVTRATLEMSVNSGCVSIEMKPMPMCVMDMAPVPILTAVNVRVDGPVYSVNCRCVSV